MLSDVHLTDHTAGSQLVWPAGSGRSGGPCVRAVRPQLLRHAQTVRFAARAKAPVLPSLRDTALARPAGIAERRSHAHAERKATHGSRQRRAAAAAGGAAPRTRRRGAAGTATKGYAGVRRTAGALAPQADVAAGLAGGACSRWGQVKFAVGTGAELIDSLSRS